MIVPVIMAGGNGTRMWPLSRSMYPKQFLSLVSDTETMLQSTLLRLADVETAAPILICNEEHRFIAAEQIRALGIDNSGIILEPFGRNTAPAIALAAIQAQAIDENANLLILAADHVIQNTAAFTQAIAEAKQVSQSGGVATFGIVPTAPETGYGYIHAGSKQSHGFAVEQFVEKPDSATAQAFVTSGDYYWNSGMFMVKATRYLELLGKYKPDMLSACQASIANPALDFDFIRLNKEAFAACPDQSVDYAVMEPLSNNEPGGISVIPLDAGWSDVGSWSSLWEVSDKDASGNVIHGDVMAKQANNNHIHSGYKLVSLLGVDDLVVVDTKDALLVAHKDSVQDVKQIVNQIKADGRTEHKLAREVYRPWGKYDSIDTGDRFQVKRITVKPGERVSIQMHHHRAEHWIVVKGTALITINGEGRLYSENEAAYIPITATHCMENPGKIDLEIIEVQTGGYLGEDDIVRFEDKYGRSN
ncbi:mannose-1-phosphate guanylyltransferase/mannose-6-phosphate isomerase [Shewanella kaireitica]|uniref:mannose-1-phosphate guanylyltransferase/mannose-6-phosphate isomerase n=1 Tax=Shewanella kaireitica TaxID=212021 RepID=UPI00200C83A7|nr:mannose-1-phosphate guanylyltransferase/mannose-6-phosphate isomerase [Shewanella kaireitica]MCL1095737.1 mannose-1-phosphate guanylyltransferase/mannose-6-phosphate isomerase [Shewanella kaireitica]